MISRSLILQILQAAKIMRRFFYEAPAEIMRNYTTNEICLVTISGSGALIRYAIFTKVFTPNTLSLFVSLSLSLFHIQTHKLN